MMNVAISAQGTDWNASVETHFGRARYLLTVDSETGRIAVHDNIKNLNEVQGAGIRTAQTLVNLGARVLLTGSIGPKALETLRAAGVIVYVGVTGSIAQAIEAFQADQLFEAT
jgi:predicted Fe-Mo cluster-binding NifX family protein